jgi:hypothetical protein
LSSFFLYFRLLQERIRWGGCTQCACPLKLEKIWFFGIKSWFFTRNTPKHFVPPSVRRNFFKCTPPNLKSWIRPCVRHMKTMFDITCINYNFHHFFYKYVICFTIFKHTIWKVPQNNAISHNVVLYQINSGGRCGHDHMVGGFTTTYAISAYHHWCLRVQLPLRARCTALCDQVCQWLTAGRWFSPGPPVCSTNNTDCHDMTEILLKVALSTINWHTTNQINSKF